MTFIPASKIKHNMKADGDPVKEFLATIPADRTESFNRLHDVIVENLPAGFEAAISYGKLGYVVPHSIYPAGYHCKPSEPLPFAGIALQKKSINLYHMGFYTDPELVAWFLSEYSKHSTQKPDMGKGCVRFRRSDEIPCDLVGELMRKISVKEWVDIYETKLKDRSTNR